MKARSPVHHSLGCPVTAAATTTTIQAQSVSSQNSARRQRRTATQPMAAETQNVASAAATANPRPGRIASGAVAPTASPLPGSMTEAYRERPRRGPASGRGMEDVEQQAVVAFIERAPRLRALGSRRVGIADGMGFGCARVGADEA